MSARGYVGGLVLRLNPQSDVETLTSEGGDSRSTYGYTAYGKNDEDRFTGVDKPKAQTPGQEPYNVYRFNAKRWDQSSQSYDMGFRDYSPGLNRFLTRDSYNGALADLNLGTDPWTSNRYAFAGGNPITGVEIDGHYAIDEYGNRVPTQPSSAAQTQPPPILPGTSDGPGTRKDLDRPYASEGVPWWEKLPGVASKDLGEQSKAVAVAAQFRGLDQASAMLTHWLGHTGDPFEFDVDQMLKEMPKFSKEVQFELGKLKRKGKGSFDSGWKLTDTGNEDPDWYFAVNNFQYRVTGRNGSDGKSQYWLQVYKRYNFGTEEEGRNDVLFPNKDFTLTRVHQPDWAHLHTVGLARDYDATGSGFFSE
ncbi:RHS repeat-associated core domain-containing protein [Kribbella qitaiheensis]|uniref:RHS repeat-associated core domain-containing protein n=1 Tax=Kribbella qitaiheensis TaxID=1544730 RepID=UPI001FE2A124|nr:RHS repeat-associated core domain-containing protein [Kribbella qitaiheensis]